MILIGINKHDDRVSVTFGHAGVVDHDILATATLDLRVTEGLDDPAIERQARELLVRLIDTGDK